MTEKKLTAKQQRFVDEYLIDLNATQAAIRAGYSEKTAEQGAAQLLRNIKVLNAIQERQAQLQEEVQIEQREILQRWVDIARANPNEIGEYRRVPCRFCWGVNHEYQWRTPREFQAACDKAAAREQPEPNDNGGYGYTINREINPQCPECDGVGFGELILKDTRNLSAQALTLLKGVKHTKDGIVIEMHDQQTALLNIAKHLGMFTEKMELNVGVQEDVLDALAQLEYQSRQQSQKLAEKLAKRKGQ